MNRNAVRVGVAVVTVVSLAVGCSSQDHSEPTSQPSGTTGPSSDATEASPLGEGELIVFERTAPAADEPDLYTVGPDGGEPRLLMSPGGGPHWSPDGRTLVFQACLNPPDCSNATALLDRSTGDVRGFSTPDPALEIHCGFAWSPDGKRLPCESFGVDDEKRNGIYTVRASDGKGLIRVTRNPGGDDLPLAYSPDGDQLLLDRTDPSRGEPTNHALFVTRISGDRPHRITPWGYTDDYASWSPDGRTIVFGTNGSLYRVSPTGQGLDKITLKMPDGSSAVSAFDVSFSPDGQRIIFSLASPEPGIYTARPDGSDVQQLTTSPTEDHHANWGAASGSRGAEVTTAVDVMAEPTVDVSFAAGSHGTKVVVKCFGAGSPVIVLEAGDDSSGSDVFPSAFIRPFAERGTTCVYDRPGTGLSDPPADTRRTIDDVVLVLHKLLESAALEKPYVLVGSSGGGNIDVQYALRHPDEVAGLVLLDVPRPKTDLGKEFPGALAWGGSEHIDWVAAERQQSRLRMPIGDFPVLVVTADAGQSNKSNQSYWLGLSRRANQVVMPGSHDFYQEAPEAVAEQIIKALIASSALPSSR